MRTTIMLANFKGGCGKTTLSHHLAVRGAERGYRVLAVDTDRQGDFYRRLVGDDGDLADMPPAEWAEGCAVVHTPEAWHMPDGEWDVVIVDTGPGLNLPEGPSPDVVIIPVDGVDAARNSAETLHEALDRNVRLVGLVFVGIAEGGARQAREFERIRENLPPGVVPSTIDIPRGGSIKRSALTCRPAWTDLWRGKDATAILQFCDALYDAVRGDIDRAGAA